MPRILRRHRDLPVKSAACWDRQCCREVVAAVPVVVGRFLLIERSSKYSGRAAGPSARQQNCNGLLRCSQAICTCSIRLMPGISQRRFHSTIRGPAAEALELLSAHSEEILLIWRERLREMGLDLAQRSEE